MSSDRPSLMSWLLRTATGLLLVAVLLWLAVWLLEQIWGWLFLTALTSLLLWTAWRRWQRRRDRW